MEILENDAPASKAAEKRRASGRAVRPPKKFVPDAPSFQPSVKRKRGVDVVPEDVENEIEQDDDESDKDEDEEDEEDVDGEEIRAKRRARAPKKHPAKKPRVNGTAATAVRLPSRHKRAKKVIIQDINAEGLYAEIFTTSQSPEAVAVAWLRRYGSDNTMAMTDLINCVLRSAGCELKVTEDDVNDPDNVPAKLNDMQEEYKEQNITDYPLISKVKSNYGFRSTLLNFFDSLITTMHTSEVLYDDIALIENIQLWITTMSSSFLRPFRHTATAIALTIVTSLCRAAKEQTEATANSLGILEGEKRKRGSTMGPLTAFQQRVDQGNKRKEVCSITIKDIFDAVFVHRYRDVDPKIRTDCVEALGQWVVVLPGIFMEGTFLRYLGWMFSDISAPTRHEAVKQLERILRVTDNIGGIQTFIERFRQRIIEMAGRDSDIAIRASAIGILNLVREARMLEPDDVDVIGRLIFDSEPRVRKSIVGFFVENIKDLYESKIEELGREEVLEHAYARDDDDYEKPCVEWLLLKCLAEELLRYDLEDGVDTSSENGGADTENLKLSDVESRFSLAAHVLYDDMREVKNWKMLAGYLLFDYSVKVEPRSAGAEIQLGLRNAFKLEEKEEVILLEILDAAVKLNLAQPDDHEKARDKSKKKGTTPGHEDIQESIARHLAVIIPRLLSKFGSSPKTAAVVLRLEQLLNLGVFQSLRMEQTGYVKLLHEIGTQFKGHSDQRVLSEASAALLHARSFEELEEVTEECLQSLWEDTLDDLRKRYYASSKTAGITARGNLSIEHLTRFATTVARVSKLASIMNPTFWFEASPKGKKSSLKGPITPIDILIELINRGILTETDPAIDDLEEGLVTSAIQSALFYFMWKARTMQESISESSEIADIDVDAIKGRLDAFKAGLFNVLNSRAGIDDLRLLATGTLLDAHVLFSTLFPAKNLTSKVFRTGVDVEKGHPYAYLKTLVQEIEPRVQEELTSIFVSAEILYAKKARKVLEPPADDDEPEDIESDSEDDDVDGNSESTRKEDTLKAELELCELAGKFTLGILAGVIDRSGPSKGKLRARIQRNRYKLGPNFKEVIAYLDHPKPNDKGGKKSHKSKAQQAAAIARKAKKTSAEVVEEDDDNNGEVDDAIEEPGDDENIRNEKVVGVDVDEDDVMGD